MSDLAARLASIANLEPGERTPQIVPFGSWTPDLPDLANPGAIAATNVIPAEQSYKPFPDLSAQSAALDDRCRGAIAAKDNSGNAYFYAGDATKLYEVRSQAVTNKSGATYATANEDNWRATQFGSTLIFTNYTDAVQGITIGSGGNFSDLISSTNKPKAKHIMTLRQFVVLGNTNDATDGIKTSRIWWSGIGDATDFDPDSTTQSDYEDLQSGGQVTGLVGGADYGVVFQETQISRMSYTGDAAVFRFDAIDRQRGTQIPGSIIGHGRRIYYISEEGFFVFTGSQSIPIGANRVDNEFWDQFDISNASRVFSAIDFVNKLVCWLFPGDGSTGGNPNKIFVYNWEDDKWARIDLEAEILVSALTQAFTLEDLDAISTDIDAMTVSFDDPSYQGGLLRFAGFTTEHKLGYFTGSNLAATIDTGEFQPFNGQRSYLDFIRPLVDGTSYTLTAQIGSRNLQTETASFTTAASPTSEDGIVPVDVDKRYHRVRVNIAAGGTWKHAQGVQAHARPSGAF